MLDYDPIVPPGVPYAIREEVIAGKRVTMHFVNHNRATWEATGHMFRANEVYMADRARHHYVHKDYNPTYGT